MSTPAKSSESLWLASPPPAISASHFLPHGPGAQPAGRLPGPRYRRRDAVIRVINVVAPGRSVHHPGVTPGGVIVITADEPWRPRGWPSRVCKHVDFAPPEAASGIILHGEAISPV